MRTTSWLALLLAGACRDDEDATTDTGADADADADVDLGSDAVWDLPDLAPPTTFDAFWVARLESEGADVVAPALVFPPDGALGASVQTDVDYVATISVVLTSYPDACASMTAMQDALNAAYVPLDAGDPEGAAEIMEGADTNGIPADYWQVSVGFASTDEEALGVAWPLATVDGVSNGSGGAYHHREDIDWSAAFAGTAAEVTDAWEMEGTFDVSAFDPDAGTLSVTGTVSLAGAPTGSVELTVDAVRCPSFEASFAAGTDIY